MNKINSFEHLLKTPTSEKLLRAAEISTITFGVLLIITQVVLANVAMLSNLNSSIQSAPIIGSIQTVFFFSCGGGLIFTGILLAGIQKYKRDFRVLSTLIKINSGELVLPDSNVRRVLIISNHSGGGHESAANALEVLLKRNGFEVDIIHPFDRLMGSGFFDILQKRGAKKLQRILTKLQKHAELIAKNGKVYEEILKKIVAYPPNLVISVQPVGNQIPYEICKVIGRPLVVAPTDFKTTHFFHGMKGTSSRLFKIALPDVTDGEIKLLKRQFQDDQLVVTGGVLRNGFQSNVDLSSSISEIKKEFEINPNDKILMFMKGAKGADEREIIREIEKIAHSIELDKGKLHIIVLCGSNKRLHDKIKKMKDNNNYFILPPKVKKNDKVILHPKGRVDDRYIAALMSISHAFYTKPGGGSTNEGAAKGVYMILDENQARGCSWEEANLQRIIELGLGTSNLSSLIPKMQEALNRDLSSKPSFVWHARDFDKNFMQLVNEMLKPNNLLI